LKEAPITEVVITGSVVVPEESGSIDRVLSLSCRKAIRFTHSEQSVSSLFD
jgi:phosphoribosylpyrophosphate synthetase